MSYRFFSPCRLFCLPRAARLHFSFCLPLRSFSLTKASIHLSSAQCVRAKHSLVVSSHGRHDIAWNTLAVGKSEVPHRFSHHCGSLFTIYFALFASPSSTRRFFGVQNEKGGVKESTAVLRLPKPWIEYGLYAPSTITVADARHAFLRVPSLVSSVGSTTEAKRGVASVSSSSSSSRSRRRTRPLSSTAQETDRQAASLSKRLTSPSSFPASSSSSSSTSTSSSTRPPAALPFSHKKFKFRPQLQPGEAYAKDSTASHESKPKGNHQKKTAPGEANADGKWHPRSSLSGRFNRVVAEKGFAFGFLLYLLGETINLVCACIWHWGYLGKWFDIRYWLLVGWCFGCAPSSAPVENAKADETGENVETKTGKEHHRGNTAAKAVSVPLRAPQETSDTSRLSHLLATWDSTVTSFHASGQSNDELQSKDAVPASGDPPSHSSSSSRVLTWIEYLDKGPVLWEEGELSLSARFIFHYAIMNMLLSPCYRYQYQCCEKLMPVLHTISSVVLSPLFALARAKKSFPSTH